MHIWVKMIIDYLVCMDLHNPLLPNLGRTQIPCHPWQQFCRVPTVFRYIFCVPNNVPNRCHPQDEASAKSGNGC